MPLYADNFAGHMFDGDPRNPLTGAFACTWPTVPAYRYRINAPNAFGVYIGFNITPPLIELTSDVGDHDVAEWEAPDPGFWLQSVLLRKLPIDTEFDGFQITLTWKTLINPNLLTNDEIYTTRKCNKNIPLPNWNQGPMINGEMGEDAELLQVVWDETEPP